MPRVEVNFKIVPVIVISSIIKMTKESFRERFTYTSKILLRVYCSKGSYLLSLRQYTDLARALVFGGGGVGGGRKECLAPCHV